jgi:hypothetical protein
LNLPLRLRLSNERWDAIWDNLKTHATLEVLDIRSAHDDYRTALAVITSRIQALLDMMKMNMAIHTIHLNVRYREHTLFRESVIPYLVTNRFRPRIRAIQRSRPIPYRAKVLGRALLAARTDANSLWMLLSGNAEVAFPSTTVTASLATPATTAATSNAAAPVVATAAIPLTATGAASTTGTSAAATFAPPIACQKCKVRP